VLRARRRDALSAAAVVALSLSALGGCASGEVEPVLLRETEQSIVGGTQATTGAWPTAVSIQYDFSPTPPVHCGGTLIAPTWVLTAAHCFNEIPAPSFYHVVVGRIDLNSSIGEEIAVAEIVQHPSYHEDPETSNHDIALLRLATAVAAGTPFTRLVSPGRMSEIRTTDDATVVGWGRTGFFEDVSTDLRQVTMDVIGIGSTCDANSGWGNPFYGWVTNNQICIGNLAGGQDACEGDSGGPALVRRDGEWFQLGLVSYGAGCGEPNLPGVYTYLPNYLDWVRERALGAPAPSLLPSAQILVVAG
jgi:secreted trypsin-like serine protease